MSLGGTEDRLSGPELRRRIEATLEHKRRIRVVTGDDVLPRTRQPFRRIRAEEVTESRLAQSVEMFVRAKERWLRVETNAGFFTNLPDRRLEQPLVLVDATRRNLGSRLGMVTMVEDKEPISSFDVDDDALPDHCPIIVGRMRRHHRTSLRSYRWPILLPVAALLRRFR